MVKIGWNKRKKLKKINELNKLVFLCYNFFGEIMNNNYEVEKNVEKLYRNKQTRFLDGKMQQLVKGKISSKKYSIYYPYPDSEKVIFYTGEEPKVSLVEIISREELKHQSIMGSLFALGISGEMFGDIIITNNRYYVYVLDEIKEYILLNLDRIGNVGISLKEVPLETLEDYIHEYEVNDIIVSSERLDVILAHIIHTNRDSIKDYIKRKEILLNYELVNNNSKKLNKGDIFSIRKYGKYRYEGIIKETKSNNLLVRYLKYK